MSAHRPLRVAMYVYNDVTRDSRVLREAAMLAEAGHEVTVIGRTRDARATHGTVEERDRFRIVRLPIPARSHTWASWLARPWNARRRIVRGGRRALRRLPRSAPRLGLLLGFAVMTLGWTVGRGWLRLLGRVAPTHVAAFDWLARWLLQTNGWASLASRVVPDADVHHGHDLTALPAAAMAAERSGAILVYDSHEAFVASGSIATRPRWARAFLAAYERRLAASAEALVTVNGHLARLLGARVLGARRAAGRVVVLHNTPALAAMPAAADGRLRRAIGVDEGTPLILYHGAFSAHRGLEQLAEAILEPGLERAHLVFLGYGSMRGRVDELAADPRAAGRIHVLDAVPPTELLSWIADADVGAMPLLPSTLNHRLATPNKLFECMAAGVPVVASDLPGMRRIVLDPSVGPLGALCRPDDPASLAAAIRGILEAGPEDREALRARLLEAARTRWNWEREGARLLELYASFAGGPPPTPPVARRYRAAA